MKDYRLKLQQLEQYQLEQDRQLQMKYIKNKRLMNDLTTSTTFTNSQLETTAYANTTVVEVRIRVAEKILELLLEGEDFAGEKIENLLDTVRKINELYK